MVTKQKAKKKSYEIRISHGNHDSIDIIKAKNKKEALRLAKKSLKISARLYG